MLFKLFKTIKSERGTSIAEILLVVALIGILSAVTIASLQIANQRERVRAAARDLTSLLREAQTQSIEGQHERADQGDAAPAIYYVVVNQEEKSYTLYSSQNNPSTGIENDNLIQSVNYHPSIMIENQGVPTDETIIFKPPFGEVISPTLQLVFEGAGGGTPWQVSVAQGFGKIDVGPFSAE